MKLENLVLVKFNQDSMVVPRESEWFGFYKEGQSKELYTLEESPVYLNDTLGLKTLDQTGIFILVDTYYLCFFIY